MKGVKLGVKDRKILDVLAVDGRISYAALARKVGVSKQVAKYKVEAMEKAGVIKGYSAFVDFSKISKNIYSVSFDLMNISEDEIRIWADEARKNPNVISFIRNSGKWDASLIIVSSSNNEFNSVYKSLTKDNEENIKSKMITIHSETFVKSFVLEGEVEGLKNVAIGKSKKCTGLDKLDFKLVDYLLFNGRDSSVKISEEFGVTPSTVRNRISSLRKKGIVCFFSANINYDLLGYDQYRVYLFLNETDENVLARIRDYLFGFSCVDVVSRFTGYADMEFSCFVEGILELNDLSNKIRTRFKSEVRDIESLRSFN